MICLGNCIDILLEWLSYLHEMVRELDQNHGHPCVQTEPQNHGHPCVFPIARIISTIEQLTEISDNVFPNIIIIFWNPLIQFPQFATVSSIQFPQFATVSSTEGNCCKFPQFATVSFSFLLSNRNLRIYK